MVLDGGGARADSVVLKMPGLVWLFAMVSHLRNRLIRPTSSLSPPSCRSISTRSTSASVRAISSEMKCRCLMLMTLFSRPLQLVQHQVEVGVDWLGGLGVAGVVVRVGLHGSSKSDIRFLAEGRGILGERFKQREVCDGN
jgi:hypothetical protein